MGKRVADLDDDVHEESPRPKRAKTQTPSAVEEIFSARQLSTILAFRQDAVQQLKNGWCIAWC